MTRNLLLLLACGLMFSGCNDPEVADPAALVPGWKRYTDREVGIEFKYPYTLELVEKGQPSGQVWVALEWVGRGTPIFSVRSSPSDEVFDSNGADLMVGGLPAWQTSEEVGGETVQRTVVVSRGREFVFTGRGSTFDKVLRSVVFLE